MFLASYKHFAIKLAFDDNRHGVVPTCVIANPCKRCINLRSAGVFRQTRLVERGRQILPLPTSKNSGRNEAGEDAVEDSQRVLLKEF